MKFKCKSAFSSNNNKIFKIPLSNTSGQQLLLWYDNIILFKFLDQRECFYEKLFMLHVGSFFINSGWFWHQFQFTESTRIGHWKLYFSGFLNCITFLRLLFSTCCYIILHFKCFVSLTRLFLFLLNLNMVNWLSQIIGMCLWYNL